MEAHVAMSSLEKTIKFLKDSSVISISCSAGEIMDVLEETVRSFESVWEIENDSARKLRDAVLVMEDVLESHISNQLISSQSEDSPFQRSFIVDLEEIKKDVDSFAETISEILMGVSDGCSSYFYDDDDDDDDIDYYEDDLRSRVDFGGCLNDRYFGLSDQFEEMKYLLMHELPSDRAADVMLCGMAGIGKTAFAKRLFHDPEISSFFSKRAFVTVGQKYRFKRVFKDIQKQVMDPKVDGEKMLIVLDDIWDVDLLYQLKLIYSRNYWPNCALAILLTSRLQDISTLCKFTIPFMDKQESWDLLRHKLFDKTPCPPQLEKAGKKIAEKCEGLPLTIITIADIISKADEKTSEEYWNKVSTQKRNSVFMEAYDKMFDVLYLSYNHLDIGYKPCFLYLGGFPQNHEISCSKLLKLFHVEGFAYFRQLFKHLVSTSVVIAHKWSLAVNTCSLHSSYWHMCNKEAGNIKLFHGVDSPDDLAEEDVKIQRRLCIRNNVLLAFEDVYNSMASISNLRSLLCTGPHHQYPVPICLEYFRLLRILDALAIHFYEFPIEVHMKLIHLRYLALTYDGNLPPSIFKLFNLHYLIVHRHIRIIEAAGNTSYLPMEIWLLKELKYLRIMGGNLPDPSLAGLCLPNLEKLLDVGPQSCTKAIFECMPKLEKLGIRIELAPNSVEPLCFFDHISHLCNLENLKCIFVNPNIMSDRSEIVPPPPPLPLFTKYLKRLTLSGFGYPWEDMCKIAQLPNLEVLKLECYAFRGPKWEVDQDDFPSLRYLMIEDTDLVHLTFGDSVSLPDLEQLIIKHCYKLQEIPLKFGYFLEKIELVECKTSVVACAIKVKEDHDQRSPEPVDLIVHSTWST